MRAREGAKRFVWKFNICVLSNETFRASTNSREIPRIFPRGRCSTKRYTQKNPNSPKMSGSSAVYLIIIICLILGIVYYAGSVYIDSETSLKDKYKGKTLAVMRIGLSRVLAKLADVVYAAADERMISRK